MACDRRASGDAGVVLVIVAAAMAAIVIVVSIVINLGGARHARAHDQDAADAIAIAGASNLNPSGGSSQAACNAAWTYAVTNLDVATSPAPNCVSMAGNCDEDTPREVSVSTGAYTLTFVNPVPDDHALFTGQPATATDATPCERFGVEISHDWRFPFDRGHPTLHVQAMARFIHAKGEVDAPLVVLNAHDCEVLTATGNSHVSAVTSTGLPGYIAIDSDGANCGSGKKVIVDATGSAQLSAGAISMWALATGNASRAYDPSDVGPGKAFDPAPIASSAPVGRSAVDWRYNCLASNGCPTANDSAIADLVAADGGTGVPAGFTRWTSVYSCRPSGNLTVPRGDWYVDCPGGLVSNNIITFRGGNIVSDGPITVTGSGKLRVNCDVAFATDACPADPATTTIWYLRSGDLGNAGSVSVQLYETFVYVANGTVNLGGTGSLTWTAPDDPSSPFDDLLVWTESSSAVTINGTAGTDMEGIFFAP